MLTGLSIADVCGVGEVGLVIHNTNFFDEQKTRGIMNICTDAIP